MTAHQRPPLRSGAAVHTARPIAPDAIAEKILAYKADGIYHEPPEPPGPAHFPARKPKPTPTTRRQR